MARSMASSEASSAYRHGEAVGGGGADQRRAAHLHREDRARGLLHRPQRDDDERMRQPRLVDDLDRPAVVREPDGAGGLAVDFHASLPGTGGPRGTLIVALRPQAAQLKAYHSAYGRADWSRMARSGASQTGQATDSVGAARHAAMRGKRRVHLVGRKRLAGHASRSTIPSSPGQGGINAPRRPSARACGCRACATGRARRDRADRRGTPRPQRARLSG